MPTGRATFYPTGRLDTARSPRGRNPILSLRAPDNPPTQHPILCVPELGTGPHHRRYPLRAPLACMPVVRPVEADLDAPLTRHTNGSDDGCWMRVGTEAQYYGDRGKFMAIVEWRGGFHIPQSTSC